MWMDLLRPCWSDVNLQVLQCVTCEPELDGFSIDQINEFGRQLALASTVKRKGSVGPEQLAKNWNIGFELAK
jgi:hypothetical protein